MNDLNTKILSACTELIGEEASREWLSNQIKNVSSGANFFIAFGMAPKKVGKHAVSMPVESLDALSKINPAAVHTQWTLDELVRLALLQHVPLEGRHDMIKKLLATSDIREQKLIYKALQYLDQPEEFRLQVIDGIRTNMTDVFDAIALHNSYPKTHFQEGAWNQMVLKAIFMERPIYCISGLDERRNQDLARIAIDFAHERQSAGRKVTPELWRLVVPFVGESMLPDLIKIANSTDELEKEAGIRALKESSFSSANTWLENNQNSTNSRSWNEIGATIFKSN